MIIYRFQDEDFDFEQKWIFFGFFQKRVNSPQPMMPQVLTNQLFNRIISYQFLITESPFPDVFPRQVATIRVNGDAEQHGLAGEFPDAPVAEWDDSDDDLKVFERVELESAVVESSEEVEDHLEGGFGEGRRWERQDLIDLENR